MYTYAIIRSGSYNRWKITEIFNPYERFPVQVQVIIRKNYKSTSRKIFQILEISNLISLYYYYYIYIPIRDTENYRDTIKRTASKTSNY